MPLTKKVKAMLNLTAFLLNDHSGVCVTHWHGQSRVNQVKEGKASRRPWSEAVPQCCAGQILSRVEGRGDEKVYPGGT